jgi:hypothetical protein
MKNLKKKDIKIVSVKICEGQETGAITLVPENARKQI